MKDFLNDPFSIFKSGGEANFLLDAWEIVRGVLIILDVVLLIAFIIVFTVALKYRPHIHPKHGYAKKVVTLEKSRIKERWENILRKAGEGTPDAFKLALIEADKLTDDVLKGLGLEGEHMADRLEKLFPQELNSLDRVWKAHRVRNNLVHIPDFSINENETKKTLEDYEAFLKEVRAL